MDLRLPPEVAEGEPVLDEEEFDELPTPRKRPRVLDLVPAD